MKLWAQRPLGSLKPDMTGGGGRGERSDWTTPQLLVNNFSITSHRQLIKRRAILSPLTRLPEKHESYTETLMFYDFFNNMLTSAIFFYYNMIKGKCLPYLGTRAPQGLA